MKKNLLILTEYFYPAVNGGGPVTSIYNISSLLKDEFDIKIICQNRDYDSEKELENIESDKWISFENKISVYYSSKENFTSSKISQILRDLNPHIVYINSIYIIPFIFKTIATANIIGSKVILAPRGMLQTAALNQKKLKKQLYFNFLKLSGTLKNITWQSTNKNETEEIKKLFPDANIELIENIPARIAGDSNSIEGKTLKLCSISLNTRMKNLNFFLETLAKINREIIFDIYGPIRDAEYWKQCELSIKKLPENIRVNYIGSINPLHIAGTIQKYHLLVSPTLGENFGHSIFEALANGVPVLISDNTPWKGLQKKGIGYNLELKKDIWHNTIESLSLEELNLMRARALNFSRDYFNSRDYKKSYIDLFN